MRIRGLIVVAILSCAGTCFGQKMTLEEARSAIPNRPLPAFWRTDLDALAQRWSVLEKGESCVLAKSPGGRALHLVTFGRCETPKIRTNFNSAVAARKPSSYIDKKGRTRPVLFFIGPVHGQETEGLVALVNLIEIMETGRDLRGREQAELRRLGERCRLLILPSGNPDGLARFEPKTSEGLTIAQSEFWGMGTWSDDTIAMWPDSKRIHPHVGPEIGFLGCYFNDLGVNPMHDEFFAPMSTEAPAILQVARREGPDWAVSLHSHASAPAILRPAYVPLAVQQQVKGLADRCSAMLEAAKLPHANVFIPAAEDKNPPAPFNLTSAIYHTSGAAAFTFESPRGVTDEKACRVDFEQMLDLHLILFEAMLRHALDAK